MPSGGYRRPTNPAPVSGPGAKSRRTDGKQPMMDLPDAAYGENKTYREQQQGAPLAQDNPLPSAPSSAGPGLGLGGPPVVPFDAETQRPDEPVTSGADAGAGPGTEVMDFANERSEDYESIKGALPFLRFMANMPGSSWAARNAVRDMQSKQGS
jgi:hypothetical protein